MDKYVVTNIINLLPLTRILLGSECHITKIQMKLGWNSLHNALFHICYFIGSHPIYFQDSSIAGNRAYIVSSR